VDFVEKFVDFVGIVRVLPNPSRDGRARGAALYVFGEGDCDGDMVKTSEFGENMGRSDPVGCLHSWDVGVRSVES
jgi:hypothetical protein